VGLTYVRYEADGWGIGELVLDGDRVLHSELPRPRAGRAEGEHPLVERLQRYFAGERVDFADVEVELGDETAFSRRLAAAMRAIPYGEVVSYGELAALSGHPNAQRAAGSVCANNRFPLVVPCHRVVAANGIGRYGASGVGYKRRLLELEGVTL